MSVPGIANTLIWLIVLIIVVIVIFVLLKFLLGVFFIVIAPSITATPLSYTESGGIVSLLPVGFVDSLMP